jgi:hypothetical protein
MKECIVHTREELNELPLYNSIDDHTNKIEEKTLKQQVSKLIKYQPIVI